MKNKKGFIMEQWEVNAYLSDIELNIKNGNTETALDGLNTLSVKLGGGEQIPCANAGLCSVAGPEVRAGLIPPDLLRKIEERIQKAEKMWPEWPSDQIHAAACVCEEAGELIQACIDYTYKENMGILNMNNEALDTITVAIRFIKNLYPKVV